MPTYCYLNPKTAEIIEEVFPMDSIPEYYVLDDGTVCERCLPAEIAGQGGMRPTCWPMKSHALAVHPSQRDEFAKFDAEHGVPTEYDRMGKPIYRSQKHRKAHCELHGAVDYDGGYGDATDKKEF